MYNTVVVVGAQWGDEGKGKVTDYIADLADMVVRYQGGTNAGHTVVLEDQEYRFHLIPSGILHPDVTCVIGNGLVIDLEYLVEEINLLKARGLGLENLKISSAAHVLMPYHRYLDQVQELKRGNEKIGTTQRGIGPAYTDKYSRSGIRLIDLRDDESLAETLRRALREKNELLRVYYGADTLEFQELFEKTRELANTIREYVADTPTLVNKAVNEGKKVLFEGAQGTLLDIDHGTYPYVTSSNPTAGGACTGSGVGPTKIRKVMGVLKSYTTRVGEGPFPTELHGELANYIREKGKEYGTTTGRPRRVGWLDVMMLRYSALINGLTSLAITKMDTLAGLPSVKICTGYRMDGRTLEAFPNNARDLSRCEPIFEELEGWGDEITTARCWDDLPSAAKTYIARIRELVGCEPVIVSVGREREQTITLSDIF